MSRASVTLALKLKKGMPVLTSSVDYPLWSETIAALSFKQMWRTST